MSIKVTVMSLDFESEEVPESKIFSKNEIVVGRSEKADLMLSAPEISAEHLKIILKNGEMEPTLYVSDLGSSNGTLLESKPLSPNVEIPMAPNERIVVGNYLLKPEYMETSEQESSLEDSSILDVASEVQEEDLALSSESVESEEVDQKVSSSDAASISSTINFTASAEDDEVVEVNIFAKKLLSIRGQIISKGKPVAGVLIDAGPLGEKATTSDGSFEFGDLLEGLPYELKISKERYLIEENTLSGTLEDDLELTIEAKKLITVKGKVVHNGVPLAGVELDAGPLGKATTAEDGSYQFNDVPEGTEVNISASKLGFQFDS